MKIKGITKELLLETAKNCRSFREMSKKLGIIFNFGKFTPLTCFNGATLSQHIKKFGIYGEIRAMFRAHRQINPVWTGPLRTKESILELAKKSHTVAEMSKYLNITRERARQIIKKLGIEDEVWAVLDSRHYGIEMPLENVSCVFALYFQNDPTNRKFFARTHHIRNSLKGYYAWMKKGKKINHPLIQACKKYGISNLKWEIIKKCPPGELRKETHKVIMENISHSMNLKMAQQTKRRKQMLLKRRFERIKKIRKPKKSKYPGVYYHFQSGLWMAHPHDSRTGNQHYLGYYIDEEKANQAILDWKKTI